MSRSKKRKSWRVATTATIFASLLSFVNSLQAAAFGAVASNDAPNAESPSLETVAVYLDELDLESAVSGYNVARARRSTDGAPLRIGSREFERGISCHSQGHFVVSLPENIGNARFKAVVGIDDEVGDKGHIRFRIVADGRELWSSDWLTGADVGRECDVDVSGLREFVVVLDEGPEGYAFDHGDLGDARIVLSNNDLKSDVKIVSRLLDENGNVLPNEEWSRAFAVLKKEIAAGTPENVAATAANVSATIWKSDRDPLDVVLRRTQALVERLESEENDELFAEQKSKLNEIAFQAGNVSPENIAERRELFRAAFLIQREIALKNPLLDFQNIVFIKRHYNPEPEKQGNHMCDQFFGFHSRPGGGLFVLKNAFSDAPQVVNLLANSTVENGRLKGTKLDETWGFLSPHLSFDGTQVYFAAADTKNPRHSYEWTQDNCYHLFRVNIDGSHLTQLTDGPWNDFDPCLLPNGRIAFISERRGGYGRCHARPCPSYTLHSSNSDGSDIVPLSVHETNEWAPTVDRNGMIVYTRWDYVDRGFNQAHHPWATFPDGRDSRAIQGNYSENERSRPHFETSLKQAPDSSLLVGTACGHHTQYFGSIILIDPNAEDDDTGADPMAPIRRVTPEQPFPEAEIGTHGPPHTFGQPYPLSDEFFLVVYDPFAGSGRGEQNDFGVYLLDVFGNKTLLYRDENISSQAPWPLRERETPPIIPHQTLVGIPENEKANFDVPAELPKTATVGVANVYETNRPFPDGTKIKELRIVQVLPKTTVNANVPWIGFAGENGARKVLGTVPVEEDGSARFEAPVNVPFYIQALDAEGVAVQTMRSATYVHPGETLTCVGCHEGRQNAAQNQLNGNPTAFERSPSTIRPDVPGSNPFNYPTLVQTVLDRNCVDCHQKEAANGKTFELGRGDKNQYFSTSYVNLRPFVYVAGNNDAKLDVPIKEQPTHGGAWNSFTAARTFPGQFGANRSPVWKLLKDGHYGVELKTDEKRALALWLDNNCDFFGAYEVETLDDQRNGKAVQPTLE